MGKHFEKKKWLETEKKDTPLRMLMRLATQRVSFSVSFFLLSLSLSSLSVPFGSRRTHLHNGAVGVAKNGAPRSYWLKSI